jgi:carboxypeptidase Q
LSILATYRRLIVRKFNAVLALLLVFLLAFPTVAQMPEPVDYDAIQRIKTEGFANQTSRVMEIMSYLTDVYGPRLTNSPNIREAADYAMKQMTSWGLANVHLEPWADEFGRGWANERFSAQVIAPHPFPLIAYPKAWTPGTNGPVTAEVVLAPIENEQEFDKYKGQLRGKFVITATPAQMPDVTPHLDADAHRYTDQQLGEIASQPVPTPPSPAAAAALRARFGGGGRGGQQFAARLSRFLADEGVAAWLEPQRGDDGTVFVQGGAQPKSTDPVPPRVAVLSEHLGRIVRILDKKIPVTIEMNIQNKFFDQDKSSFNILGEIPGTDKADEVVMLGAHFDSWHGGTGATDNGAGSAVMLEAMRILKATGLKMRRTVRIGLWTGEEQGLLGSRAYVTAHFADRQTMQLKPEHAKFAGYFNVDNGTGKIRGVYLQGNEAVAPIFDRWMQPFHNLGMNTLTIRNTGGTDHLSFDAVGLPGFQFIQDPMDYDTRTHHSNMDVYERIQEADMKQMAVIVASFVYMTANRPEKLPRKPLPKPQPAGPGGRGGPM